MLCLCIFIISFLSSMLSAEVVPAYGARVLSQSGGARSYTKGADYITINPASSMSDEISTLDFGSDLGLGYFSSSINYLSEYNYSLQASITDLDAEYTYGSLDFNFAYAYAITRWLVAGSTISYQNTSVLSSFDTSFGICIGEGAEKKQNGFMSSLVFKNLLSNHGFREFSAGMGYVFPYGFNISIDDVIVQETFGNRMDFIFSFEVLSDENNSIQFSVRIYDFSSLIEIAYGGGWSYSDEDFKIGIGVNGTDITRLLYGFTFAWNY